MVENSIIVLDASVAVKWYLSDKEGDLEEALLLKESFLDKNIFLLVPQHFLSEFSNTIFRKFPQHALSVFSDLQNFKIPFVVLSLEVASLAGILMKKYPKISFYDAAYHALAMHKEGTFVTADEQYYKTTKKEGHILLLKNYK